MNTEIPLIIIGLFILYTFLSIENFNVVQEFEKQKQLRKKDLEIKPSLLRGRVPVGKTMVVDNTACAPKKNARGKITNYRENLSKYIRKSMLLNKPNHTLGFLPSNVRFMDLTYNKPNQIGKLPLSRGNIPKNIKLPKLPQKLEEEERGQGEE